MGDDQDLALATECWKRNEFAKAQHLCEAILQDATENARAWHLLGIVHGQCGRVEQTAECIERATEHDMENALYHYNLGLAYKRLGQLDRAIVSYRNAIEKKDAFLEARINLAGALIARGSQEEATGCLRELLERFPESSPGHYNLAGVLQDTGHFDESIAHYRRALELDPHCSAARENLGRALADAGHVDQARDVWRDWLAWQPDNAVARHMLASLSGENIPQRCDDEYIRETFNEDFATNFDQQLERLQYAAPALIGDALNSIERTEDDLEVLDAGCGTGLCGPIVRRVARHLVGVDLSEDMLAEARKRSVYDETIACEITQFMSSHARSFDLVVSADTFCYFGELGDVLQAAARCLRDRGILIFTVESATEPDRDEPYELRPNGRYGHTQRYVAEALRHAGFSVVRSECAVLRKELGRPVEGRVLTASRREQ